MAGYYDCLADVLPQAVIDAMRTAVEKAIHHGGGRPGEPVAMAGIRALLDHVVLKSVVNERDAKTASGTRALIEAERKAALETVERGKENVQAELSRLAAVWQLVDRRRKTLPMDDLVAALGGQP